MSIGISGLQPNKKWKIVNENLDEFIDGLPQQVWLYVNYIVVGKEAKYKAYLKCKLTDSEEPKKPRNKDAQSIAEYNSEYKKFVNSCSASATRFENNNPLIVALIKRGMGDVNKVNEMERESENYDLSTWTTDEFLKEYSKIYHTLMYGKLPGGKEKWMYDTAMKVIEGAQKLRGVGVDKTGTEEALKISKMGIAELQIEMKKLQNELQKDIKEIKLAEVEPTIIEYEE